MKTVKNILIFILKVIMYWFYIIPINFTIIAFAAYNIIIYLIFGTLDPKGIEYILESNGISMFLGFVLPFGIPYIISFFTMFSDSSNRANTDILDSVIAHRNNIMSHKSDKEAYIIYKKTGNLDMMKSGVEVGNATFNKAVTGFNATVGISNPAKVYKDLMDS